MMMLLSDRINRPNIIKMRKWNGIIEDVIQVGDRVRDWGAFMVIAVDDTGGYVMKYNTYLEGTVIAKKKSFIDYELTVKKEKYVFNDIVKTSNFTFGDTTTLSSRSETLELLTPQMRMNGVD